MRAIFISYRRNDAEGEAGRLFDDLVREFGDPSVFMDVSTIQAGRDFRKVIDESVATCGVVLAIIGVNWVDAKNEAGERRLDDPADFVRLETASALRRDIPVIPVLVRGAKMPSASALPDDLKELAYRNAVELTHARWNSDVQVLVKSLRQLIGGTQPPPQQSRPDTGNGGRKSRRVVVLAASAAAVAAALGIFYFSSGKWTSVLTPALVEIPDVVGKSLDSAEGAIHERQLFVGDIQRESKDGAAANSVLKESPPAGRSVKPGSKIDLVVAEAPGAGTQGQQQQSSKQTSGQAAIVQVPNVVGRTLSQATSGLQARGLSVGRVTRQTTSGATADTVLSQSVVASQTVPANSSVDLVVAVAPKDLPITLTAGCKPCSVQPGGKVVIYVMAKDPDGSSISGARVSLAAGGGDFGGGGGTRYGGDTDARGVYQTIWTAPQVAAPAYGLGVEVSKDGFHTNSTKFTVNVERTGRSEQPQSKYPNFGGTWEMFEITFNGTREKVSARPLVITQNGGKVTIGDRTLSIRGDGAVSYQTFAAGPSPEHTVETASQADLIDTLTWRLDGAILVLETVFDYRRTYGNHGPGRDLRIMKYRRVQ
ncbi:MAG TPA: PASTA domain-containing protein [Terriglobales bacterium]|nr:PASTA domain-containing protein [Terriglobales bacterium]